MILAKPVVKNKFWILKEDDRKIGTVENTRNGFLVRAYNQEAEFKTIKTIKNRTNIIFEETPESKIRPDWQVNGFLTNSKPYNAVYDVKRRLPLFTKKNKSKSWYAAGYYQININGNEEIHFCPKLILLQRYDYIGPVHSKDGFTYQ